MNHPFSLKINGFRAQNIPIGDIRTSDPYLVLKIAKKIVGRTSVIRFTLSPDWKEEFEIPLLHLYSVVTIEIWDHDDVRPHKMLGKVEFSVEKIPIDGDSQLFEELIRKGDSNIEPRGMLIFSASIKNRGVIIKILPQNEKSKSNLCPTVIPSVLRELSDTLTSQPIQDCFMSTALFSQEFMSWSIFRDLLYDVNQLSLPSNKNCSVFPTLTRRIDHSVKFSNSLRMDLLSNTTEIISPQQKNSFILHTLTERFIFIPPNKYSMWLWIATIKKFYFKFLMKNREVEGNTENKTFIASLKLLYQYHHHEDQHFLLDESEENELRRFYEGILTLHVLGSNNNILCKCVLDSRTMVLSCQDQTFPTDPPIHISLANLQSISVSRDFPLHQPYDLKFTIVSSKVSVTALADALKRGGKGVSDFEVDPIETSKSLEPSEAGWHPGRFVVEGTKLTTKIVKTVVLGTIEGTSTIAKSTADLATTAAEGLVSIPIAAVGLSLQREEITTRGVLNSAAVSAFSTRSVVGIAPYWDSSTILKLDRITIQESNSFGVSNGPCGVTVHLLSKNENENNECFLGSKFIPYTQLIPKDSLLNIDDHILTKAGGLRSNPLESTFTLDSEIAYRVDVIRGRELLAPPQSNSISTILSHPLDSFIKLSTLASTTVGLTSPANLKNDRNPRISCSFVKWEGSPVANCAVYKSPTIFNTLNPTWNQTFILSTADGLHDAAFIQLVIKDESRSGEDHLMGVVYIPKEEFFSAQAVKGDLIPRTYPILPMEGMSAVNLTSSQLGYLDLNLQLLSRPICPTDNNYAPPEMTIRTEVIPSNEYSTSWLCDCTTEFQIRRQNDVPIEMERFYITMGYHGMILDPVKNEFQNSLTTTPEVTHSLIESTLHQFQKKTSVIVPPGWDGTPPQIVEMVEYHIFQNQRRYLGMWGSNFLHEDERSEFTDESGSVHCPFTPYDVGIDPPNGFEWEPEYQSTWLIDREYTATDQEGWSYGVDFGWIMTNYREGKSSTIGGLRTCRRRRWKRIAKRIVTLPVTTVDIAATERETLLNSLKGTEGFDNDYDDSGNDEEDDGDSESVVGEKSPEIKIFELYENQRRSFTLEWGKEHLFRAERAAFSDETGDITYHYDSIESSNEPPPGYEWIDQTWNIDKSYTNTDEEGWVYGIDFTWVMSNLKKGISTISPAGRSVRRRKYFRRMRKVRKSINNMPQNISINASRKSMFGQRSSRYFEDTKIQKDITTKLQAYNLKKDAILSLCKERESIFSSVVVPWNQVLTCDVVTPTVLMLNVLVHRYFGEDSNKEETYRPAEVRVFIVDCPAEKLSVLVYDRQHLSEYRENISTLISCGTIYGPNPPVNSANIYSECVDENNNFQLVANELSLGSSTNLYLEKDLMALSSQIDQLKNYPKQITPSSKSLNLTESQYHELVDRELKHLEMVKTRILLYITSLLEVSLEGPSYDEILIKEMIFVDHKVAENLYHYLCQNQHNTMDAAEQIVHFLLDTAEMRIRDTALCGWSHRGRVLESCLQLLINGYYTQIVGILGRFFESKEGLMTLQSNESKLQLIQFFVQHNSHFNNFVQSSLRPYRLVASPPPLLSLCLDVNTLISWYAEILAKEMKKYVQNIFLANYQQESKETYCLPWEVVVSESVYISAIPADTISILTNYLKLVRLKTSSVPPEMREGLKILDERIRIAYIDCFLDLATEYRNILSSHNWTLPLPQPGRILDEESTFRALGMHIEWICSVANDCQHILDEHINASLEISFDDDEANSSTTAIQAIPPLQRRESINMSSQNQIELNESVYKLTKLLSSLISLAMDTLSCLMFKSFLDFLPTTNLYKTWKIHVLDPHKPSCIRELLLSMESYLEEDFIQSKSGFHNSLEIGCLEKLVDICLKKTSVWYLCLLRECYLTNISLNDDEIAQIRQDCIVITEYFITKIEHLSELVRRNARTSTKSNLQSVDRFQRIENQLELFSYINILLTEEIGSPLFSKTCLNLSEISTHEKSKAYSHRQLLLILFKIGGGNSSRGYDETLKGVDTRALESGFLSLFDSSIQAFGNNKLPVSYLVDPPPEILVFHLQANLERYLVFSSSKRLKKEQEINLPNSDEKIEGRSFLSDHVKISLPKSNGFSEMFSFKSKKDKVSSPIAEPQTPQSTESIFTRLPFQTSAERMNLLLFPHIEVKNLYALDRPTDVYVSLQLNQNGKHLETSIQPNKLNPVWEALNDYAIPIAQHQIESSFIICNVYYRLKFRLLPLKVGMIRLPLGEILSNEDGVLVVNDYPLEINSDVGTAKEILETLKYEDKHRQLPLISLLVKLNIVTKKQTET